MVVVKVGKVNKRYHKDDCYGKYLRDQKFKKKEKEELDSLVEAIKKIHGIEVIPNQFFSYLQDLRNGNELFGNIGQKKSKSGYEYYIIEQAYLENEDSINWARNNRDFKGNSFNFLKYTFAIIKNKIAGVNEATKQKEYQEKLTKEQELNQDYDYGLSGVYEHSQTQKGDSDEFDISKFL